jgi:hypothetical protein
MEVDPNIAMQYFLAPKSGLGKVGTLLDLK